MAAHISPELSEQLAQADADERPVGAVMRLAKQFATSGLTTEQTAKRLVDSVAAQIGTSATAYNVFKNLGYFVVYGKPAFIRKLAEQPEVDHAQPNEVR